MGPFQPCDSMILYNTELGCVHISHLSSVTCKETSYIGVFILSQVCFHKTELCSLPDSFEIARKFKGVLSKE